MPIIIIAQRGVTTRLRAAIDATVAAGMALEVVQDIQQARGLVERYAPCMVELGHLDARDPEAAAAVISNTLDALGESPVIAITDGAESATVLASLRAGAESVFDLELESAQTMVHVIADVWERSHRRERDHMLIDDQRNVLDDLLKALIQTERRTIDLESDLAKAGVPVTGADAAPAPEQRPPAVILVSGDPAVASRLARALEAGGLTTVSYGDGDAAVREVGTLKRWGTTFDIVVLSRDVAGPARQDTIRRLRELMPDMAAAIIGATATDPAREEMDRLGLIALIGDDAGTAAERVTQLAREALAKLREHLYLDRIKARHDKVLARYRALARPR